MKKLNKFITFSLIGLMALVVFSSVASAQNLRRKDRQARIRYQTARQQYLKEVNWWKTTRQQFLNARARYRKFRKAENKKIYEEQARKFLERTINVLIRKLESLKNWVANRPTLSEEVREKIVAEIEQDINWLQEKKSGISTASPAQIREKAKEIRDYWRRHRIFVKRIIGEIWVARLDWAIKRFEDVSSKIAERIEKLKESGKDTSQLESWLADFNQKIDLAKEKRDKAREKYQAISSLSELNQFFSQTHQFVKEANQYLREAHKVLVKIVREMRRLAMEEKNIGEENEQENKQENEQENKQENEQENQGE